MRPLLTIALILLAGCPNRQNVPCGDNSHCDLAAGGACLAGPSTASWCAYPDSTCPEGFRFSDFDVGDGVGGQCVGSGSGDAGADAPSACVPYIAFHRTDGLYVVKPDGMGIDTRATGMTEENPVWSPDGARILFERTVGGAKDIFSINADGTGLANLTVGAAGDDYNAVWSPNGQYIAFISERNYTGSGADLFVMEADGRNPMLVDIKADGPSWSPDSLRIAYASYKVTRFQIYVANRDGMNSVNISNSNFTDTRPRWSPDGSKIAFEGLRGGLGVSAYLMNADGMNQQALAPSLQVTSRPIWSPNGQRLTFNGALTIDDETDVYRINADRMGLLNLTAGIAAEDRDGSWSPDGTQLAIVSKRDGNFEIYRINDEGTGPLRMTTSDVFQEAAPAWSPCM
ncbi:MAG: PD40 domain-containing protein [Deltaproteobacteria bacterium]|nr:PD40 domain-containing protein [Deltaproteobacteria bacterium]